MFLSTKFPLVLRFHFHEQQKVKVVRVSGIDSTVNGELAAVQIGTKVLVYVIVFQHLMYIACSFK